MSVSLHELGQHVRQLAATLDVEFFYEGRHPCYEIHGWANATLREVHVYTPSWSQLAYWIALHELGHIHHGHLGAFEDNILHAEAEAWVWAFEQSKIPMSPEDQDWCGRTAFASYLRDFATYLPVTDEVSAVCNRFGIAAQAYVAADPWQRLLGQIPLR